MRSTLVVEAKRRRPGTVGCTGEEAQNDRSQMAVQRGEDGLWGIGVRGEGGDHLGQRSVRTGPLTSSLQPVPGAIC